MTDKTPFWTRVKHAIVGKPISYEEHRAAQQSLYRDPKVDAQLEMRNQRFTPPGF